MIIDWEDREIFYGTDLLVGYGSWALVASGGLPLIIITVKDNIMVSVLVQDIVTQTITVNDNVRIAVESEDTL